MRSFSNPLSFASLALILLAAFAALSLAEITAFAQLSCIQPPADLVSWWPGEGDATDIIGTNSGTLFNGVGFVPGKVGRAFSFNGTNSYVEVPDAPALRISDVITIECWLKRNRLGGGDYIIEKGGNWNSGSQNYAFALHTAQFNYAPHFLWNGGWRAAGSIADTNWHHCAVVATNGQADPAIYVDGVQQPIFYREGSPTINLYPSTKPLHIGAQVDPASSWFFYSMLDIDEMAIYNRGLSAAEIQAIYNAGSAGKCSPNPPPSCALLPSGPISWWKGEGNARDTIGANNGSVTGGVSFVQGEVGRAFSFDGTGEIVIPATPTLNVQSFTIETWVNPSLVDANVDTILNKENELALTLQDTSYELGIRGAPESGSGTIPVGHLTFFMGNVSGLPNDYGGWVDGGGSVPTNVWTHCALTYNGTSANVYINGTLTRSISGLSGAPSVTTGPFKIGSRSTTQVSAAPSLRFNGLIDEVTLYNRALAGTEIQAIFKAGSAGKCTNATPIPPFIIAQPGNRSINVGGSATFTVSAGGTQPLSYQWRFNGTNISGATASAYSITNAQLANAGAYSALITNVAGPVLSSNAVLTVTPGPSLLKVANASVASGGSVTVPIILNASGSENTLGFSLSFPTNRLAYAGTIQANGSGATLFVNANQTSSGRLGILIGLPAGATFPPGTQELVEVTFTAAILTNPTTATITFVDQPVVRQVSDVTAHSLPATYTSGNISIAAISYEADASPRPGGDRVLTATDWVQVGRFAARLDSPAAGDEFQRADCAPRFSRGDGRITIRDWVQAGRYVAGLDPLTPAGGPTSAVPQVVIQKTGTLKPQSSRQVSVATTYLSQGQSGTVSVRLQAQGDENSVGFSLTFDPGLLTYVRADPGSTATSAMLNINDQDASSGHLGFALALPIGSHFSPGAVELVRIAFTASATSTGSVVVAFNDVPIDREVSDSEANALTADFLASTISVNPLPTLQIAQVPHGVLLTWPAWATNFVLQESADVSLANWTNVVATTTLSNNQSVVTLPIGGITRFYRLSQPMNQAGQPSQ